MLSATTYSLALSPCSSAAAVSALAAVSPAPAPDGGSPSSSGVPAAPADALKPGALAAAARQKKTQESCQQSYYIKSGPLSS